MRALDPEVIDAVWAACEPLIPERVSTHRWAVTDGGFLTRSAFGEY